jgi:hypothetical protein
VVIDVYAPGLTAGRVTGVRYGWGRYLQCSLYNGAGGWDHRQVTHKR